MIKDRRLAPGAGDLLGVLMEQRILKPGMTDAQLRDEVLDAWLAMRRQPMV